MAAKRILVVDDETPILDLLRDVLTTEGYEVDVAANSDAALALVRASMYDAALLDFNLPDMDGVMLHHRIREMDPELASRCVFMSGFAQRGENLDYYSAHGGGFISKPFDIREVLSCIRNALA